MHVSRYYDPLDESRHKNMSNNFMQRRMHANIMIFELVTSRRRPDYHMVVRAMCDNASFKNLGSCLRNL